MEAARTVTVVMPTRDRKKLLRETLASLAGQTYPAESIEVVVVDDCSSDGTLEFLRELETPLSLVPIRHEVNKGRAAARNTALRAATGDLVVFVDDDMRCDPDLIRAHVRFHETHPKAMVIGSAVQAPELGRSTVFRYLDEMGVHKLTSGSRAPSRYFVTNNASIPREPIIAVGLFDESFRKYGFEDTELAFRLEDQADLTTWFCGEAVAYHLHAQTLDGVLEKRRDATLPLLRLIERHPERAAELSADALMPLSPDDGAGMRAKKLLVRWATNEPCFAATRALARAFRLGPFSRRVMVYLIAHEYRLGLAENVASRAS